MKERFNMKKVTLIILRVKGMSPMEFRKSNNWTESQIAAFVKGLKAGHPGAIVEVSTVTEEKN